MELSELLTVEDCFNIRGRGLVLIPDFSVPNGWKNRTDTVVIIAPDGRQYEASAQFTMSHFNLRDPKAPIDKRYRVTVLLSGREKEEVPVGSKIMVSQTLKDAIIPKNHT